jgi:TrmH family RNA methyltransferase
MITSTSNKHIKDVLLIKKRHSTLKNTLFFIEGKRIVDSALNSNVSIKTIFYTQAPDSLLIDAADKNIETLKVDEHIMKVICSTITPQGIAAIVSTNHFDLSDIAKNNNMALLICDRVKDPGNMGNAIRAADGFGAGAVIVLAGSCNPFSPKVVRATSGSIFNIPIVFTDINNLLLWIREENIALIATHPHQGIPIYSAEIDKRFGLIIGEEGGGIDNRLLSKADLTVTIPIAGMAESLNVAVSAAICLYEIKRRSKTNGEIK